MELPEVSDELDGLFEQAVHIATADGTVTETERRGLTALQVAFDMSEDRAATVLDTALGDIYAARLRYMLADGVFTKGERAKCEGAPPRLSGSPRRGRSACFEAPRSTR